MGDDVAGTIAAHVLDRSAEGIAATVSRLVANRTLQAGDRLPPVRDIAKVLNVSASTIGQSWKILGAHGLIDARGRQGTFVREAQPPEPWRAYRWVAGMDLPLDLATGFPDPDLLVDLRPFLRRAAEGARYDGYPKEHVDPGLRAALRSRLLVDVDQGELMISHQVNAALAELLPLVGPYGTPVVVGDPEFAPYLDLLARYGLRPTPVRLDAEGPVVADVVAALDAGARAVVLQPRGHNPSGVVTSQSRLRIIAEECQSRDVWIIEIDYLGDISDSPAMSAWRWAPDQTAYIRAFSKDLHPDLRIAVVAGAPGIIGRALSRRVGGFDVSRVNQDLLRLMLNSDEVTRKVAENRIHVDRRRNDFISRLLRAGVEASGATGWNVWVRVRSEAESLVFLAANGVSVAPGSSFSVQQDHPHIRVSAGRIPEHEAERVAQLVVTAAGRTGDLARAERNTWVPRSRRERGGN